MVRLCIETVGVNRETIRKGRCLIMRHPAQGRSHPNNFWLKIRWQETVPFLITQLPVCGALLGLVLFVKTQICSHLIIQAPYKTDMSVHFSRRMTAQLWLGYRAAHVTVI